METRNIEAFITVAETLNFSAAAKDYTYHNRQ